MAETKIEWADFTFNPWIGCTKVSPACDFCYAERDNKRRKWAVDEAGAPAWGPGAPRKRTSPNNWRQPFQWAARQLRALHAAAIAGEPIPRRPRVFCASLADVFDNEVEPIWRVDLFNVVRDTSALDWLLLTKRIGNAVKMLPPDWGDGYENVLLGATIANQEEADRDIPKLLRTPARRRFLSIEPIVGPINLRRLDLGNGVELDALTGKHSHKWLTDAVLPPDLPAIDWVITGGESGPEARPTPPKWFLALRNQCTRAGVPFLFKQWGEWQPAADIDFNDPALATPLDSPNYWRVPDEHGGYTAGMIRVGKKAAGRELDGRTHDGFYQ